MNNPYIPFRAEIIRVTQETGSAGQDVKTFTLRPEEALHYRPGQFSALCVPGVVEAPFGFSSAPSITDTFEITVKRAGLVTDALHCKSEGDYIWLRGPFGNFFPSEKFEGQDIFFVAGGLGLAPLRPLIDTFLKSDQRRKYRKINILVAARVSCDFIFRYDYNKWASAPDTKLFCTIDNPEENWDGFVGFPHDKIYEIPFDRDNAVAVLCGPPIMIKSLTDAFSDMGISADRIYTSLEMRMSCGVGKCGRCNVGRRYVCIDGPVFSMAELSEMPGEY